MRNQQTFCSWFVFASCGGRLVAGVLRGFLRASVGTDQAYARSARFHRARGPLGDRVPAQPARSAAILLNLLGYEGPSWQVRRVRRCIGMTPRLIPTLALFRYAVVSGRAQPDVAADLKDALAPVFKSCFTMDESVDRLRAATRRAVFSALAEPAAVRPVKEKRVRIIEPQQAAPANSCHRRSRNARPPKQALILQDRLGALTNSP